jgi:hypothetical protein
MWIKKKKAATVGIINLGSIDGKVDTFIGRGLRSIQKDNQYRISQSMGKDKARTRSDDPPTQHIESDCVVLRIWVGADFTFSVKRKIREDEPNEVLVF